MRFFLWLLLASASIAGSAQELKAWTGGVTPPLALPGLDGKSYRLEQYRGKVVLINFWATWCEPCRDEMPSIGKLRKSLAGQPFEVLAVNLAEPESRIRGFIARVPMDFPVLLDGDTGAAKAWGARVLPATYLVGPDGRIRYSVLGEIDWARDAVRKKVLDLLQRIPGGGE